MKLPDYVTAYKYPIKSKVELEAEFNSLAEEWRADTRMLSLVTHKSMHPAYQRIIGMGQPVVPFIFRDLEQKPDHWFWALRAITGANPVKPEQRGRMSQMAQAWIQWGKANGYVIIFRDMVKILWTEYMQYRAELRGFDLSMLENIIRFSAERYNDTVTGSQIVVGKHNQELVIIPYEINEGAIIPITVHTTTRQQIKFRLTSGRFVIYE